MNQLLRNSNVNGFSQDEIYRLKQMFALYKNNPQGFLNNFINQNPQLKSQLQQITNPNETLQNLLAQRNISIGDFEKILKN